MKSCFFRWNDLRLRHKLMVIYFAVVFIPVMLTNSAFYWKTAESVRRQKVADYHLSLEKNKETFQKMIEGLIGYSSALYSDVSLYNSLDTSYTDEDAMLHAYNTVINPAMNRFVPIEKQLYNAYVYTNNPTLISAGVLKSLLKDKDLEGWYEELKNDQDTGRLKVYTTPSTCENQTIYPTKGACGQPYLSIIRKLDFYNGYDNYDKLLKIDIIPQFLENTLQNNSSPGPVYLLNPEGIVVFSSGGKAVGEVLGEQKTDHTMVLYGSFDNVSFLKGWKMVGVYPDDQALQSVLKSQTFILYLTIVNFLFPSVVILLFSRSLNTRIGLLLKQIKRVKNQRFEPLLIKPSSDEIGQLTEEFNRMTVQISRLIQDVYLAELDRKQAQFNALQSQINPHYLFNTLESIRMNCVSNREMETASIIRRLAKGLRRSIEWGNDRIPLREEMDFVSDFLEIQKFRFEQRINYQLSMDDSAKNILIPKFSILPLVENACIHGIENSDKPGLILVSVHIHDGMLVIEVTDNGPGMDEEDMEKLRDFVERGINTGRHVGLKNVHDRLKWHFGSEAVLNFDSKAGAGTSVKIYVPVHEEGYDAKNHYCR
ncbi:two-component system, sensor histidine kinase YesM [Fontibacillus panacisegetis]|uniref:histidine kinase n=1 Tax=Fontibacillus panacisegetis TaxID=670482 RepID=A0A1G7FWL7_9BACL|nr:histidine kinase [Fontibacillus panacisegetis]SDE80135.1 two-component system, sensor histidine kinase YesM [Fontibacillus panacisegetis]